MDSTVHSTEFTPATSSAATHDPACDQCRAKKIKCGREKPQCQNCRRFSLTCEFSGRGKRPNQVAKLTNDFDEFSERLERIEQLMSLIAKNIEQIQRSGSSCHTSTPCNETDPGTIEDVPIAPKDIAMEVSIDDENDCKSSWGPASFPALTRETCGLIDIDTPELAELLSNVVQHDTLDISHDAQPLVLPLRPILEAMVEPFFSYVHPILPIFCKRTLNESIETIYGGLSTGCDHAWKICLNNIIILTLIPQTHQRHSYDIGRSSNKSDVMHSEASMVMPFIENSRRAFQNLELLLQPRLVHVQALATSFLVSQENFQPQVTKFLLSQTCNLARSIGLHRQDSSGPTIEGASPEMLKKLFWTLFISDTNSALTFGTHLSLPSSECSVDLPSTDQGEEDDIFLARIRLAQIQQRVHVNLFSTSRIRQWSELKLCCCKLLLELEEWKEENARSLNLDQVPNELVHLHRTLGVSFRTTRILIMKAQRSSQSLTKVHLAQEFQDSVEDSRECIRTILALWTEKKCLGNYSVLLRLFENNSFVFIFEVFRSIYLDGTFGDLEILQNMVFALKELERLKTPEAQACSPYPITKMLGKIAKEKIQTKSGKKRASTDELSHPFPKKQQLGDFPGMKLIQSFNEDLHTSLELDLWSPNKDGSLENLDQIEFNFGSLIEGGLWDYSNCIDL